MAHRPPSHDGDHANNPKLTLPFAALSHGGAAGPVGGHPPRAPGHTLAYGNPGGGHFSGLSGELGNHLTGRLINSVADTYSTKFPNQLSQSLQPHMGNQATAANRSPATVVPDRFGGFGAESFEPRFSVPAFGETRYVPNEIVLGLSSCVPPQQMTAIARRNGFAPVDNGELAASGLTLQRWRVSLQGEAEI